MNNAIMIQMLQLAGFELSEQGNWLRTIEDTTFKAEETEHHWTGNKVIQVTPIVDGMEEEAITFSEFVLMYC